MREAFVYASGVAVSPSSGSPTTAFVTGYARLPSDTGYQILVAGFAVGGGAPWVEEVGGPDAFGLAVATGAGRVRLRHGHVLGHIRPDWC